LIFAGLIIGTVINHFQSLQVGEIVTGLNFKICLLITDVSADEMCLLFRQAVLHYFIVIIGIILAALASVGIWVWGLNEEAAKLEKEALSKLK